MLKEFFIDKDTLVKISGIAAALDTEVEHVWRAEADEGIENELIVRFDEVPSKDPQVSYSPQYHCDENKLFFARKKYEPLQIRNADKRALEYLETMLEVDIDDYR